MKRILSALFGLATAACIALPAHAQFVNAQTGTTYTFVNTDCGKIVTFSNTGATAATLPVAGSLSAGGSFLPPCRIEVVNLNAGLVTITPTTSTIAGGNATMTLASGEAGYITSDGTNYQAARNGEMSTATYYFTGTSAATNQTFFAATHAMRIIGEEATFSVAAGGTSTLTVEKITGVVAPGSGVTTQTGSFNLNATANTPQAGVLTATAANAALAPGDRLGVVFANTIQSTAGLTVTVSMIPQ